MKSEREHENLGKTSAEPPTGKPRKFLIALLPVFKKATNTPKPAPKS
jgi:hypothetical protein